MSNDPYRTPFDFAADCKWITFAKWRLRISAIIGVRVFRSSHVNALIVELLLHGQESVCLEERFSFDPKNKDNIIYVFKEATQRAEFVLKKIGDNEGATLIREELKIKCPDAFKDEDT